MSTEPLYDLFLNKVWVMRARLAAIEDYLDIHPDAIRRINYENAEKGFCLVHMNRGHKAGRTYCVQKAGLELGCTAETIGVAANV